MIGDQLALGVFLIEWVGGFWGLFFEGYFMWGILSGSTLMYWGGDFLVVNAQTPFFIITQENRNEQHFSWVFLIT